MSIHRFRFRVWLIVRQTAGHMKFIFILSSYTQNSNWTQICRLAFFLFLKEKTQGEKKGGGGGIRKGAVYENTVYDSFTNVSVRLAKCCKRLSDDCWCKRIILYKKDILNASAYHHQSVVKEKRASIYSLDGQRTQSGPKINFLTHQLRVRSGKVVKREFSHRIAN